jgi:hypothetical protein
VRTWIKNGVLTIEKRKESNRKDRQFVVPGPWTDVEADPDPEDHPAMRGAIKWPT